MSVWNVSISELSEYLHQDERNDGLKAENPQFCLHMIQASNRWAFKNHNSTGYPNFLIQNDVAQVMGGVWTESLGAADRHNTYQNLSIEDLQNYGMDAADLLQMGY